VTNHTTDTEHLPHDRECPQASLILRGQVRDLHLPVRGYLPFYFIVGASLQNSKLHKVKVKSKTQLVCHKTTIVLMWSSKRFLIVGF
jgi:hypothetical protein